tara:strand:+ start:33 stop:146 length:114 start_codon:yes stop_codon:yes gene_type:complete
MKTIDIGYYLGLPEIGQSKASVKFDGTKFSLGYLFKK